MSDHRAIDRLHMRACRKALGRAAAHSTALGEETPEQKERRLIGLTFWTDAAALHLNAANGRAALGATPR